jgi:hypothetical protein
VTLDPRRVALQGIGSTPLAVALQGLVPVLEPAVPMSPGAVGGGAVATPGSATISLSEWLRQIQRRAAKTARATAPDTAAQAAPALDLIPADDGRASAARRRRQDEELLLLLDAPW